MGYSVYSPLGRSVSLILLSILSMKTKALPLLILIIAISFYSCSQKTYTKYGSRIVLNKNTPKYPNAYVHYQSYSFLIAEAKNEAKVQMWDSARLEEKLSLLPKGGYVILTTANLTLESAMPENYEVLITDSAGNKILREKGKENSIPNYRYNEENNSVVWTDMDIFKLDKPINSPFKVFVFNTLSNTKGEFDIYPNKK